MKTVMSDSADGNEDHGGYFRYLGYVRAAGLIAVRSSRYLAYTSDIVEAFRPILSPNLVRLSYGVSWLYIVGDVGVHGYNEYKKKSDPSKIG